MLTIGILWFYQDSRPEVEYSVSHINRAKRVDPDLSDIKEVINDVLQKAQQGKDHLKEWICKMSTISFISLLRILLYSPGYMDMLFSY